jgi:hypothetical protein
MKTAVLEFQQNRVKRQPVDAASADILRIIVELRSALRGIGRAIEAVERLAIARLEEDAWEPPKPARKKRTSKMKRKGRVIALPHLPEVRDDLPAVPESAGAQT